MYEQSVGRGSNFLLNVGPDDRGRINERDAERVRELGCRIKAAYGNPLDFGEVQRAEDGSYSIATEGFDSKGYAQRAKARLVNTVVIEEDLSEGQGVREFKLYAHLPAYNFKRILIFNGSTVGHKLICRFPTVNTPMLTVEITHADGTVAIKKISAYLVK
jgi:alpha-L-fucosidase